MKGTPAINNLLSISYKYMYGPADLQLPRLKVNGCIFACSREHEDSISPEKYFILHLILSGMKTSLVHLLSNF